MPYEKDENYLMWWRSCEGCAANINIQIDRLYKLGKTEKNVSNTVIHSHTQLHSLCVLLLSVVQVNDVVFSSDEKHFATCSEDGSVRVWSAPSNELVVQFQVLNQVRKHSLGNILNE